MNQPPKLTVYKPAPLCRGALNVVCPACHAIEGKFCTLTSTEQAQMQLVHPDRVAEALQTERN